MTSYKVRRIWKYTDEVEVNATSPDEAIHIAEQMGEGERNEDDWLFDCEVMHEKNNEAGE